MTHQYLPKNLHSKCVKCLLFTVLCCLFILPAAASSRFFHLSSTQLHIDSALARFTYAMPLPENYRDSTYRVEVVYPEFTTLSPPQQQAYRAITTALPPTWPTVEQTMVVQRKQPILVVSFSPYAYRDGHYCALTRFMLRITSQPRALAHAQRNPLSIRVAAADRYTHQSVLAQGRWVKIKVAETGVHQLSESLIHQAGFTDINKVHIYGYGGWLQNEVLREADLIAGDDLHEVAQCVVGGRHLFYAKGTVSWDDATALRRTRNPYSDYGYYFLTESSAPPRTMNETDFLQQFYPSPNDYHTLIEDDSYAWYHGGRNLYDKTPIPAGQTTTFSFAHPPAATAATLSVNVSAGAPSVVEVAVNDQPVGQLSIQLHAYDAGNEAQGVYVLPTLQPTNRVRITTLSGSPCRMDYVSMTWNAPFPAPQLATDAFPIPTITGTISPQNLHGDGPADMVIIVPSSGKLTAEAERLKTFHAQHDGLRVKIVAADALYNEFSSGTPDVNAYRRYLKMLYDRAANSADAPRYLLLFGDCLWDNRLRTTATKQLQADDYLLCYESENSFNAIECYVSDTFLGMLDDGEGGALQTHDIPDIGVGRFPVSTPEEARTMVDKTIRYAENADAGAWQNTLLFMGDDGNQNLHMDDANDVADAVAQQHPALYVKKVMWDAYKRQTSTTGNSYPDVRKAIIEQQQRGALIMDYAGHGSEVQLSHEGVLNRNDFANFTHRHLPLWITASCDIAPFDGLAPTLGETAVRNAHGGAVAFFGTTRTVYARYNKMLNMAYLKHVLSTTNGRLNTLGEAHRLALAEMITTGKDRTTNKLQYALLGDPALRLNLPRQQMVVDSIVGIATHSGTMPTLKAGSVVRIAGHIDGQPQFKGLSTLVVRDAPERVTCRLNDPTEADTAFQYTDRQTVIFTGTDSVRAGKFAFTFAVPRDIRYSNGQGLITLFATDDSQRLTVNGQSQQFTVGGSALPPTDGVGPTVTCYLNHPGFRSGGRVNATPMFVASLHDSDGINVTGSGIGHNLALIVDGEPQQTYNLNDHFQFDIGSYTSGTVTFQLPQLNEGRHRLQFHAWDVQNNSSVTTLDFVVDSHLEPHLISVQLSENPARNHTQFRIEHDQIGSPLSIEISVFDLVGRPLWHHIEQATPAHSVYTIDYNLTMQGGSRLPPGLYLCRVRLVNGGNNHETKTLKLLVAGNK